MPTHRIAVICEELARTHGVHTILLYGSRADGTEGPDSDYDIAGFGPVAQAVRDARVVDGDYLDLFVFPEQVLAAPSEEHLRLRGSRVLAQRDGGATAFLQALDEIHARGPAPLPADELAARQTWAHKMLDRMRRGDTEGHFRRAWLLTALLEDYFHFRARWYEEPKRSLRWLAEHDPLTRAAFDTALHPGASGDDIALLVARVVPA